MVCRFFFSFLLWIPFMYGHPDIQYGEFSFLVLHDLSINCIRKMDDVTPLLPTVETKLKYLGYGCGNLALYTCFRARVDQAAELIQSISLSVSQLVLPHRHSYIENQTLGLQIRDSPGSHFETSKRLHEMWTFQLRQTCTFQTWSYFLKLLVCFQGSSELLMAGNCKNFSK